MSPRLLAAGLLALVALAAAAPLAAADHTYSHRFVFEGRVVDAEGHPVVGREVEFFSVGGSFGQACQEGHRRITDADGDFRFCFHVHELDASHRTGVRVGNATIEKPMDTAFRRTVVTLVLEDEDAEAPEKWNRTYSVTGKVWRGGATVIEGVPVYGTALVDTPVNVTLLTEGGAITRSELMTDAYGDFDATFELVEGIDPADVQLLVETLGEQQRRSLASFSHRQTVGFLLAPAREGAPAPLDVNFPNADDVGVHEGTVEAARAPGARTPTVPAPLFVGVALFAIVTILVRKRQGGA